MRNDLLLFVALLTTLVLARPASAQISDQRLGEKVVDADAKAKVAEAHCRRKGHLSLA